MILTGSATNVTSATTLNRATRVRVGATNAGTVTIATNMAGRGTDILLGGNPTFLVANTMKEIFVMEADFQNNKFISFDWSFNNI